MEGGETEIGVQLCYEIHVRVDQATFRRNSTSVREGKAKKFAIEAWHRVWNFLRPLFLEGRKT
jgi:hypothetical protein